MQERRAGRRAIGNYSNYLHGGNLFYRWKAYEHSLGKVDTEAEIVESLGLTTGEETVVDVGTGPGWFLFDLMNRYNHRGKLIGIDPITEQFDDIGLWRGYNSPEYHAFMSRVDLRQGRAQRIPVNDSCADRVLSAFSMYHVPAREQGRALSEIKRIMKADAKFVLSTSGPSNKVRQREFEKKIAQYLSESTSVPHTPPKRMNQSYDSVRAAEHLPKHFEIVKHKPLWDHLAFYSEDDVYDYVLSIESMKDQFDPIPRKSEYHDALLNVVYPVIINEINKFGSFIDYMERDIFECSVPIFK